MFYVGDVLWLENKDKFPLSFSGIIMFDGNTTFLRGGKFHRDSKEGPAMTTATGYQAYYFDDIWHRPFEEGPARIFPSGRVEYWVNGIEIDINGHPMEYIP